MTNIYWTSCLYHLKKDPNVLFIRVRQDIYALALICPFIFSSNVVYPLLAVPAVPTFWTLAIIYKAVGDGTSRL